MRTSKNVLWGLLNQFVSKVAWLLQTSTAKLGAPHTPDRDEVESHGSINLNRVLIEVWGTSGASLWHFDQNVPFRFSFKKWADLTIMVIFVKLKNTMLLCFVTLLAHWLCTSFMRHFFIILFLGKKCIFT